MGLLMILLIWATLVSALFAFGAIEASAATITIAKVLTFLFVVAVVFAIVRIIALWNSPNRQRDS